MEKVLVSYHSYGHELDCINKRRMQQTLSFFFNVASESESISGHAMGTNGRVLPHGSNNSLAGK